MGVAEDIRELAASVPQRRRHLRSEEATKNSLVMPFIRALGYDIHDPLEVIPEFTADAGVKQHEKVDYAIVKDRKPIILVECKSVGVSLGKGHLSQLLRYYAVTDARFAILTNGVEYRFYTDLRKRNVMDESPFLVVDMLDLSDDMVTGVSRFAKSAFDAQAIWDLVHTRETEQKELKIITDNVAREFASPSRDLVKVLARGVIGKGYQKPSEWERVTNLTKRSLDRHTGTGVVAESPGESRLSAAKTEEEARKERRREAGRKAAETRRRNQENEQSSEEPDYSKYKYWQRLKDSPEFYSLFEELRDFACTYAKSLGEKAVVNPTVHYIGFKRRNIFAYVRYQPGNKCLLVYVIADLERTVLREGFTKLLSERQDYGRCNLQVFIDSHDALERAKPLIKRSYDETG